MSYHCNTCGETHEGLPFPWGSEAPALCYEIPEIERDRRIEMSSDQCIVDGTNYFVLGRIEIRVVNSADNFYWLAWVSVSEPDYDRMTDLWQSMGRETEPPYSCTLSSELPCYSESTLGLAAQLYTQPVGERPFVVFDLSDHPIVIEQRNGITISRVQEIGEKCMHG